MTKKEEFEKQGFDVIDDRETIDEEQNNLLEFLKNNYPSIYKDSEINIEELKRVLNDKSVVAYKENGYGLNFIGRNLAKAKYRQKTKKELIINEKLSKNFNETENIIIKGDNLDSLKILKKYYSGKIKCIYIDPPYNTNSDNFLYPDRFDKEELEVLGLQDISKEEYDRMEFIFKRSKKSHNGWLTFMYPRLKLARDLLTDDGAIFISIDDNEQANLKLLCDEIFGEDNLLSSIIWQGLDTIKNDAKYFSTNHEYILVYAKNKDNCNIYGLPRTEEHNKVYKNYDNDPNGKYLLTPLNAKSGTEKNRYEYTFSNGVKYIPPEGTYHKIDSIPQKKTYLKDVSNFIKLGTFWSYQFAGSTRNSNKELSKLLDKGIFNNPKPMKILKLIINTVSIDDDIVLDFFAGSGTTAHAVMELNTEDNGNRKFILCQIDEKITKEKSASYDFCIDNKFEPVISSITIERVNRAGEKIIKTLKESNDKFDNKKIDIGYKVFDLHDINDIKENEDGQIEIISNGVVDLSRIYNMIINVGLNSPVSKLITIIENCAYMIEEDNIKTYYITNSEILIENDENKQKFKYMIENGNVYIDGWTVNINASLQQYKDNIKIVL